MKTTLITGATGFLGRHLLWRLLKDAAPDDRIIALLRATSAEAADQRLIHVLDDPSSGLTPSEKAAAGALRGDVAAEALGAAHALTALQPQVTHIIHCAASVDFTLDLDASRKINVGGTRNMLDFARTAPNLQRFDYIGTAFAAGARSGTIRETGPEFSAGFHNSYERSKAESEVLVRAAAPELPTAIFRPSIIVGDSKTGVTQSFNVLYWPLKVFARRMVLCIPANPDGLIDIVPIDYVRDAIFHIRQSRPADGTIYHITCGPQNVVTVDQMVKIAAREFNVWTPPYVSPGWTYRLLKPLLKLVLRGERRRVLNVGEQYLPYLAHTALFDDSNARAALAGSGIAAPPVERYFSTLVAYCKDSDWGKREPPDPAPPSQGQ